VAGPRYLWPLADNVATVTPVARFTHALVAGGSAWGTAFPSSHVAVALVVSVSAWREWRGLGRLLVAATVLLALGTIYGQFHYAVDALAGAALGTLVLAVSWPLAGAPAGAARA
jgi:membrane-associated phospholipid phosphatase